MSIPLQSLQPSTIPSLLDQKRAIDSASIIFPQHILAWGMPASGKTHLAATAIKSPHISRVYWFDLDKSYETLIYARYINGTPLLTEEEMSKVILFTLSDTSDYPLAAETVLKTFQPGASKPKVCTTHGKVGCTHCPRNTLVPFNLKDCGPTDLVVIDSGSQLVDSVWSNAKNVAGHGNNLGIWGDFGVDMLPILSAMQASNTNIIFTTHTLDITKMKTPAGRNAIPVESLVETIPLFGSRPFSKKIGKYFNYRIHTYVTGSGYKVTVRPDEVSKVRMVGRRKQVSLVDSAGQPTLLNIFDPNSPQEDIKASTGPSLAIKS